eukprot:7043892-Pyramimonas_sp.AAC.2
MRYPQTFGGNQILVLERRHQSRSGLMEWLKGLTSVSSPTGKSRRIVGYVTGGSTRFTPIGPS